ncbi:MAG: site-2 protease family protein [Promethearchaeota archaeon]
MKIGRVKGIVLKLHLSTLLIIGLVGISAASFYFTIVLTPSLMELVIVGILSSVIILISILLHELTHSLVAQKYGLIVSEIELFLFGGVSKIEKEPETPKSEIIIAIVGPLSSLIIGFSFLIVVFLSPIIISPIIYVSLLYTGISNIGLGLFNLIPAFPIDGGRVLRAFLWYRRHDILSATKTASRVGSFFAYGLMVYGVLQAFLFGFFNGFWLVLIGSYLNRQTKQAYIQVKNEAILSTLYAKEIMSIPHLEIPFDTLISDAMKNYFMIYKRLYFSVIQGETIVGVVHINDIKKIPQNQRHQYIVGYVMRKASGFPSIDERETGKEVMRKLVLMKNNPRLVVVKETNDDYVLGFIGEDEIISTIRFCLLNPEKC